MNPCENIIVREYECWAVYCATRTARHYTTKTWGQYLARLDAELASLLESA